MAAFLKDQDFVVLLHDVPDQRDPFAAIDANRTDAEGRFELALKRMARGAPAMWEDRPDPPGEGDR